MKIGRMHIGIIIFSAKFYKKQKYTEGSYIQELAATLANLLSLIRLTNN